LINDFKLVFLFRFADKEGTRLKPHNLVEMLARTVKRSPDKPALIWKEKNEWREISYQNLWGWIRDFAFGLERLGLRPDGKVAIISENQPRWLISDLAVLSLGGVTVPLDPKLPANLITSLLDFTDVEMVIAGHPGLLDKLRDLPQSVRHVILMHGQAEGEQNALRFETVRALGQTVAVDDHDWAYPSIQPGELATIVFTSGTTETPKGVMLSHANILSNIEAMQQVGPYYPDDVHLSFLPLFHTFERVAGQFSPLYHGVTIAYAESVDQLMQNLREVRPTVLIAVPRMLEKIKKHIEEEATRSPIHRLVFGWAMNLAKSHLNPLRVTYTEPRSLRLSLAHALVFRLIHRSLGGRLRVIASGGTALDPNITRFFLTIGLPVVETYGMTECSPGISANRLNWIKPGTVGKPLPGTDIRILPDGELLVKSPGVMMGYYKQEEETARTVVNGWLHTGDLAEVDKDGFLRISGRKNDLIVLSTGRNVAPQPIETILMKSPLIHQAVVVGTGRPYPVALIVPAPGIDPACLEERIQKEIETRLTSCFAPHEIPKHFALLKEELSVEKGELTPMLKPRRKAIEECYTPLIDALLQDQSLPAMVAAADKTEDPALH
jgi:long-chain acyl-CoA synthetase